jgi:hypothetical protein
MDAASLMQKRFLSLLVLALSLMIYAPAQAQDALSIFDTIDATLAAGASNTYQFSAQSGAVVSFALDSASGGLDSTLTVTDSSGRVIAANDDRSYPDVLDPLLESVTLPRTDSYTLTVRGVGETSGDYSLTMTPGFATLAELGFGDGAWSSSSDDLSVDANADRVILGAEGARLSGFAFGESTPVVSDFYAQIDVINVSSQSGSWLTGLTFRRDDGADTHYAFMVNHQGLWRFSTFSGGVETIIRDWTPHPAIVAGITNFTLSVMAIGNGFDFFYDSTYIGSNDDGERSGGGGIGLMVATTTPLVSLVEATFANLVITTPEISLGDPLPPERVFVTTDGRAMITALKRQLPISAAGDMVLNVPESSVQLNRAGINLLGIGRGVRYENFALGVTTTLTAGTPGQPAGCGLVFRMTSETSYTLAYFNQNGEYGISHREGDIFSPGVYGVLPDLGAGPHHLLVVASGNTLYFYVDGQFVGTQEDTAVEGELGAAVVNFEPNTTTCTYENLWVWAWD